MSRHRHSPYLSLLIAMLLYFAAFCWGYCRLLISDPITYPLDVAPLKLTFGMVSCLILLLLIEQNRTATSTFFLNIVLLFEVAPIALLYGLQNRSTVFYFSVFIAMLLCILFVRAANHTSSILIGKRISKLIVVAFGAAAVLMVLSVVRANGMPSLQALDIYQVYEIRGSGAFRIGKLGGYYLTWCIYALFPFLISLVLEKRRYIWTLLLILATVALYLYTGNKAFLFMLPLVLGGYWIAKKAAFFRGFLPFVCAAILALVFLCIQFPPETGQRGIFQQIYSLFIRRVVVVPANIKFAYWDYFSSHTKLGFAGILPRWLIHVPNPYADVTIGKVIAGIYYAAPDMNASTGGISTGFMRFGYSGVFLDFIMLGGFLILMDRFQARTSLPLSVGSFIMLVFMWSNSVAIELFSPWLLALILLMTYRRKRVKPRTLPEASL